MSNKLTESRQRSAASKQEWREYSERTANGRERIDIRIGLAASFTSNSLVPFLGSYLLRAGVNPAINPGQYNQIFQVCLDPISQFGPDCDTIIALWRIEDLFLEELLAYSRGAVEAYARADRNLETLVSALAGLRLKFTGTIVVSIPSYPTGVPAHLSHLDNPYVIGKFYRNLTNTFIEKFSRVTGILLFDCDALQRDFGVAASHDARQWYLYRQPFSESFLATMGAQLGRIIVARRSAPKKCLVVDCDNTLWGGVVGEDGIGGITVGDDFPGSTYRDFQRMLLHWHSQGVFIALASKNNEVDVWEVFEKHTGMVLKREHIAAWQINWRPKAENIVLIAKSLNIGTDSLVFVDDNPMEIGFMRSMRPEVIAVQLPEEPADILSEMQSLAWFDRLEVTPEDRQRTEMVHHERERESIGKGLTKDAFYKALELKLDFFRAKTEDLERINQLINKTNQFNLTTIRRTLDEVRVLSGAPNYRIYGLRVTDKFGDYGLTGVVIAEISDDSKRWSIDTLLLSCRVLGRGVETALVQILVKTAEKEGGRELIGSFVSTPKNAIAASFFDDNGFVCGGDNFWRLTLPERKQ